MPGGKFLLVMGTRPEVIKLAPVYFALKEAGAEVNIIDTKQQSKLMKQAMEIFGLELSYGLPAGDIDDRPNRQLARMMYHLPLIYEEFEPDWVVVQGDTTSALAGALSAFYQGIPVAHVEAGLFTGDLSAPFPEEGHRRMISQIASVNFAPTDTAKANLQEVGASNYHVVGNTVVDALNMIEIGKPEIDGRYVLVTIHRRESWGKLRGMLEAVKELSDQFQDVKFYFAIHPNPNVRDIVFQILDVSHVNYFDPPPGYAQFLNLMKYAYLIMTDSGGIQEEAPSFGVPVLVLRDKTERPEAVYHGYSELVGTGRTNILSSASWLLRHEGARNKMVAKSNPYGDGKAAQRIAEVLCA